MKNPLGVWIAGSGDRFAGLNGDLDDLVLLAIKTQQLVARMSTRTGLPKVADADVEVDP